MLDLVGLWAGRLAQRQAQDLAGRELAIEAGVGLGELGDGQFIAARDTVQRIATLDDMLVDVVRFKAGRGGLPGEYPPQGLDRCGVEE